MNKKELTSQIKQKRSFLCIGLDSDLRRIPQHLLDYDDPIFEFNKQIIDATQEFCVAYKPNIAFYEKMGAKGWVSLQKTVEYIPSNIFTIADAKRGDIGNSSLMYAEAFFENMNFDAITVSPYMGSDSVEPFLQFNEKWVILLALTSNKGGLDFQTFKNKKGDKLFSEIIKTSQNWGNESNMMYVVGATQANQFSEIRELAPNHFLLVPGFGKQGGNLDTVAQHMMNEDCGLLVNSSRGIIYAGSNEDFADKAATEAKKIQKDMDILLTLQG